MESRGLPRAVLLFVVAAWLAGCPIGCQKGAPQTIYEGPVEEVPLERTGRCTFRTTSPLKHPYPLQPPGVRIDGAWFVIINKRDVLSKFEVPYDPATMTFTIVEPVCSQGVTSLEISWHSLVRTVNE